MTGQETLASPVSTAPMASALGPPLTDPKITPRHLAQGALIYVRQSSPTQVQRHPESARRPGAPWARWRSPPQADWAGRPSRSPSSTRTRARVEPGVPSA